MGTTEERRLNGFMHHLEDEERAPATVRMYVRTAGEFMTWLAGRDVTKELAVAWKEHLLARHYAPGTVNVKLAAVNAFFRYCGRQECCVRALRIQRRVFREPSRELTKAEYERLVEAARDSGRLRLALLMETICGTGIRVSEVRYMTVEAARAGRAEIVLKGKIRLIMLPGKLCRKLLKYARKNKIASGEIFLTRSGKSLSRQQIWAEMKAVCALAGVEPAKVFPHNLRHLFATAFYRACRDIAKLADVLGHSSIDTTRLYLVTTGAEHARILERLRLVS